MPSTRKVPPVPGLTKIDTSTRAGQIVYAALIEKFLRQLLDSISTLPSVISSVTGVFSGLSPKPIGANSIGGPGTAAAGWLAGDSQGTVVTGVPSSPTGKTPAAGTGNALMRADATIQQGIVTTKGDVLGFDTTPNRIPIGANGQVLIADSTQALGLKWGPAPQVVSYWPGLMVGGV